MNPDTMNNPGPHHSAAAHPPGTPPTADPVWERLHRTVIEPGLCTHCGTCAGLSAGRLHMQPTAWGPLPAAQAQPTPPGLPAAAFAACPGKGLNYPDLCDFVFGQQPESWLVGCYRRVYIGHASQPDVRQRGASGGVITQTLLYLLEQGRIDGAVVVCQGQPQPWQAAPIIARSAEAIRATSQSVYQPVPVNVLLEEMAAFPGRLAYVGLPDQVAALRRLQQLGHAGACKIDYVLGPYVGTNTYAGAIESYLRANGISDVREVARLRYREGEWPGYLQITTHSGRVLRAEKFYYNYLIPFYITRSTLYAVDFTNELTDIAVGDAWSPRYEAQRGGFSVVLARTPRGEALLDAMQAAGLLTLEATPLDAALAMHGHMLDFKKRGSFIRMHWRARRGQPIPDYGYRPAQIPLTRRLVERFISGLFAMCGTYTVRRLIELVPIGVLGPLFNRLRKTWKAMSKPIKRRGLREVAFETWRDEPATGAEHDNG